MSCLWFGHSHLQSVQQGQKAMRQRLLECKASRTVGQKWPLGKISWTKRNNFVRSEYVGSCFVHPLSVMATVWAIGRKNWSRGFWANSARTRDGSGLKTLALYGAIDNDKWGRVIVLRELKENCCDYQVAVSAFGLWKRKRVYMSCAFDL